MPVVLQALFPTPSGDVWSAESERFSRPKGMDAFVGDTVVLIGGLTFSGGAEFATLVKQTNAATLIGEETGGGYCGNTSGIHINLTLPESGIRIRVPLYRYIFQRTGPMCEHGVLPDVEAPITRADVVAGRDAPMEIAKELLLGDTFR
jgi:C-terminal processing protease CtpA/Prc